MLNRICFQINHFGFGRKVTTLADLADGDVYVSLIKLLIKDESDGLDIMSQVNIEEVDDRYELIGMVLSCKCLSWSSS